MATKDWCLQCGIEGRAEKPVGIDEDGEPACRRHSTLDSLLVPIEPAITKRVEPAAVKPAPQQETTQMYNLKPCSDCGKDFIPTGARSIRCRDCKGTKPAAKKNSSQESHKARTTHRRTNTHTAAGAQDQASESTSPDRRRRSDVGGLTQCIA